MEPTKSDWACLFVLLALMALLGGAVFIQETRPRPFIIWIDAGKVVSVDDVPGDWGYTGHTVIRTDTHVFRSRVPVGSVPMGGRAEYGTKAVGHDVIEYIRFEGTDAKHRLR